MTTGGHPDVDRLADLDAGVLDEPEATALAEHVTNCADCRAVLDGLAAVRTELAALPAPTMPGDVAARIDSALASEAGSTAPTGGDVVPLAPRRRIRRPGAGSIAGAAAAAAIVALGIAVVVNHTSNGSGGSGTPNAPDALLTAKAPDVTHSGTTYTASNLTRTIPQLLSNPTALAGEAEAPADRGGAAQPHPGASSTGGTTGGLADRNYATLKQSQQLKVSADTVARCVAGLVDPSNPVAPLAVDVGRFAGKPAVVFVFPLAGHPDEVEVFIVKPSCPTGTFLDYARVLYPGAH